MEFPLLPSPERPKRNQEWEMFLEEYLQKILVLPADTLTLSSEEQNNLSLKKRVKYRDRTALFNTLQSQNDNRSPENRPARLLAQITEELLTRHNTLSEPWGKMRGNPKILKTSPPDDLDGIDFTFSFSENITSAVDITLAGRGSAYREKKDVRQQRYGEAFRQAPLSYWRFSDGSVGYKEFPFLLVPISGSRISNFVRSTANTLTEPLGDSYQKAYKHFFENVIINASDEAKKMTQMMLEAGIQKGYFSQSVGNSLRIIMERTGTAANKIQGLMYGVRKSIQNNSQQAYFDLFMQYQIIHATTDLLAKQLRKTR